MTRHRQQVGKAGETAALAYLEENGFIIHETNFRCRYGEIDIIAREKSSLIFVEVRTRTGAKLGTPAESITAGKERRLKKTALFYMQSRYRQEVFCRIDLIAVDMDYISLQPLSLRHYRGILAH